LRHAANSCCRSCSENRLRCLPGLVSMHPVFGTHRPPGKMGYAGYILRERSAAFEMAAAGREHRPRAVEAASVRIPRIVIGAKRRWSGLRVWLGVLFSWTGPLARACGRDARGGRRSRRRAWDRRDSRANGCKTKPIESRHNASGKLPVSSKERLRR
jgi:hypothetical protein